MPQLELEEATAVLELVRTVLEDNGTWDRFGEFWSISPEERKILISVKLKLEAQP